MFGTDDPYWPGKGANETFNALELSERDAEQIKWRTATDLFGLNVSVPA